jgi:ribonuclease E
LRTGVLEGSTSQCPHCQGTGIIRSTESVALAVLRGIEDALMGSHPTSLIATTTAEVALYILNNKRRFITDMEAHHGVSITVQASDKLQGANFTVEKTHVRTEAPRRPERSVVNMDWGFEGDEEEAESAEDAGAENARFVDGGEEETDGGGQGEERGGRRRRRRRGRRGGERQGRGEARGEGARQDRGGNYPDQPITLYGEPEGDAEFADSTTEDAGEDAERSPARAQDGSEGERGGRRRRRGRRGGRRGRGRDREQAAAASGEDDANLQNGYPVRPHVTEEFVDDFSSGPTIDFEPDLPAADEGARAKAGAEPPKTEAPPAEPAAEAAPAPAVEKLLEPATAETTPEAKSETRRRQGEPVASEPRIERVVVTPDEAAPTSKQAEQPARRGWWQRRL